MLPLLFINVKQLGEIHYPELIVSVNSSTKVNASSKPSSASSGVELPLASSSSTFSE